ncbi:hypothetical protein K4K61_007944 [Colletotrichum sp. SAR11_59]|nr:hypothetical protein K4K61_007944 [Colletotrichum sp. SAR11_59]
MASSQSPRRFIGKPDAFDTPENRLWYCTATKPLAVTDSLSTVHGRYTVLTKHGLDKLLASADAHGMDIEHLKELFKCLENVTTLLVRDHEVFSVSPVCSMNTTIKRGTDDDEDPFVDKQVKTSFKPSTLPNHFLRKIFVSFNPNWNDQRLRDDRDPAVEPPLNVSLENAECTTKLTEYVRGRMGGVAGLLMVHAMAGNRLEFKRHVGNIFQLVDKIMRAKEDAELEPLVHGLYEYVTVMSCSKMQTRVENGFKTRNFGQILTMPYEALLAIASNLDKCPFWTESWTRPNHRIAPQHRRITDAAQVKLLMRIYDRADQWLKDGVDVRFIHMKDARGKETPRTWKDSSLNRLGGSPFLTQLGREAYDATGRQEFHRLFSTLLLAIRKYLEKIPNSIDEAAKIYRKLHETDFDRTQLAVALDHLKDVQAYSVQLQMDCILLSELRIRFRRILTSHMAWLATILPVDTRHTRFNDTGYLISNGKKRFVSRKDGTTLMEELLDATNRPKSKGVIPRAAVGTTDRGRGGDLIHYINHNQVVARGTSLPNPSPFRGPWNAALATSASTPGTPSASPSSSQPSTPGSSASRKAKKITEPPRTPSQLMKHLGIPEDVPDPNGDIISLYPEEDNTGTGTSTDNTGAGPSTDNTGTGTGDEDLEEQLENLAFVHEARHRGWVSAVLIWIANISKYHDAVNGILATSRLFKTFWCGSEERTHVQLVVAKPAWQDKGCMILDEFMKGFRKPDGTPLTAKDRKRIIARLGGFFKMVNGVPTIEGTFHCELLLVLLHILANMPLEDIVDEIIPPESGSHPLELPRGDVLEEFRQLSSILAISKRSCPSCEDAVEETQEVMDMSFVKPGNHSDWFAVCLPPWTSLELSQRLRSRVRERLEKRFETLLAKDSVPKSGDSGGTAPAHEPSQADDATLEKIYNFTLRRFGQLTLDDRSTEQMLDEAARIGAPGVPGASGASGAPGVPGVAPGVIPGGATATASSSQVASKTHKRRPTALGGPKDRVDKRYPSTEEPRESLPSPTKKTRPEQ